MYLKHFEGEFHISTEKEIIISLTKEEANDWMNDLCEDYKDLIESLTKEEFIKKCKDNIQLHGVREVWNYFDDFEEDVQEEMIKFFSEYYDQAKRIELVS